MRACSGGKFVVSRAGEAYDEQARGLNPEFRPMTPELQRALKRHNQWFGSFKASGELKKIQVWLILNGGQIEFLTPGNSYKVKRVRRY